MEMVPFSVYVFCYSQLMAFAPTISLSINSTEFHLYSYIASYKTLIKLVRLDTYTCNTFTPHIKASSHATYIMLHSLSVLQLSRCGTTSHWNEDNIVIYSKPQCIVTFK